MNELPRVTVHTVQVGGKDITLKLEEDYAPTQRRLGAKMRFHISLWTSGRIDSNAKFAATKWCPENEPQDVAVRK